SPAAGGDGPRTRQGRSSLASPYRRSTRGGRSGRRRSSPGSAPPPAPVRATARRRRCRAGLAGRRDRRKRPSSGRYQPVGYGAPVTEETIGRPRPLIAALPTYRPGKGAKQAEQKHGLKSLIKLHSNETPDEPIDPIVAAVAAAAHGVNRYPDHRATAVREAIAARLGVGVDQVSIGTGSSGLLQQFVWAYVDPDDEVLYPWR